MKLATPAGLSAASRPPGGAPRGTCAPPPRTPPPPPPRRGGGNSKKAVIRPRLDATGLKEVLGKTRAGREFGEGTEISQEDFWARTTRGQHAVGGLTQCFER